MRIAIAPSFGALAAALAGRARDRAPDHRRSAVRLSAHRGKVIVVKFFASYCEPCTRTLPDAERVHRAHPDVVILGIDEDEYERTAHDLVSRYGLTFPGVHDRGKVLAGRFRLREMPLTLVIDREGKVRWVADTEAAHASLEQVVAAVK